MFRVVVGDGRAEREKLAASAGEILGEQCMAVKKRDVAVSLGISLLREQQQAALRLSI